MIPASRPATPLAQGLGRFFFLRAKGQWWVEVIRGWVAPAGVAGAFTKYLGADTWLSLLVAVAIPVLVEVVGYGVGWYLYTRGGVEIDYKLALEKDPFRSESLVLYRRMVAALDELLRRLPPR